MSDFQPLCVNEVVVYCISFVSNVCSTSMCAAAWHSIYFDFLDPDLPDGNTFGLQMVPSLVHLLKSALN